MKLQRYLYSQLAITFFPIFFGLFFITAVIFLVKISALTAIITVNFFELFRIFSYTIPDIIFYTMPISFFISMVITLSKLSSEYELTVITSFGLNPFKILKIFLPLTLLLTLLLLVVSVGLIPKTDFERKQFVNIKKNEANFNIKSGEFGQKFGDWLIFINDKKNNLYEDVKLLKVQKDNDQFVISKNAVLDNDKGVLSIRLAEGKAFLIEKEEFNQINYEAMYINDSISAAKTTVFTTTYDYWKDNIKNKVDLDDLTFFILTSFFPLMSLFLVITFGYFNPRYEKNRAIMYSLISIVLYYVLIKSIGDKIFLHTLYIIPILWLSGTYFLYSKTIKKEY
ncbi:LptF/LptG family permease [Aliarcobacter butzleri]|uniref:LptF/LptG family permease n=1 Tax=Aliarcobacter butzleri TaxID=28197 RepID=A0AAW7QDE5_9BACT|nr:LptF/LptG family permease [Aliarcobacter butzleri]KLD96481.1 YjgP/YjgQ family permease [Aliarcobacter butzleri L349]MCG3659119.1 LptF/LptG family permease [Aliarcobacter butzleri]MCG3690800.1 LptF/LptG family permease [Aliarcobacter butzleri]MCG3711580.1 LptF/LptG family permease [Aliarcobacter butzleri]MDH1976458.1 LptF/LptG family permease [Aliarcobacter butzleri]